MLARYLLKEMQRTLLRVDRGIARTGSANVSLSAWRNGKQESERTGGV